MLSELRLKNPYLFETLKNFQNNSDYAEVKDLNKLLTAIQNDSRLGFSVVSFIRQAIAIREEWLGDTCVRGRLCVPPGHWGRNLIRDPPSAAELPDDFEQFFPDGIPWDFQHEASEFEP